MDSKVTGDGTVLPRVTSIITQREAEKIYQWRLHRCIQRAIFLARRKTPKRLTKAEIMDQVLTEDEEGGAPAKRGTAIHKYIEENL